MTLDGLAANPPLITDSQLMSEQNPYQTSPSQRPKKPDSGFELYKPTIAFVAPFIIFLVAVQFYPSFAGEQQLSTDTISQNTITYMIMLVGQIIVAASLLLYFRPIYLRHFPFKFSWLSVVVGVVGIVVWVGLCHLEIEKSIMTAIGFGPSGESRPAFNPFEHLPDTMWRIAFLVPRFLVLALIVPLVEELFLRGWLVRYVEDVDWEPIALSGLGWSALIAPTVYGVATHPGEAIAAIAWFSLVTLMMVRTKNVWDCVVAHAVTNLLLGVYVIWFEQWQLW